MNGQRDSDDQQQSTAEQRHAAPPAISLPKGGGAIRGVGEKFAANPVTGTGSTTVPLAVSPGRAGFGPELSLSYDSGAGNGPFGFGWSLALPQISRKTDKGLPQYNDAAESDVFILSGAEDLVPWLNDDGTRWSQTRTVDGQTYQMHRYRPRIEGLFARIERWTNLNDLHDVHWRSISKDNILTLYGTDAHSRIADTASPGRIFTWLIRETRDNKGNVILYDYKPEDGAGVDLTAAHERNRGGLNDPRRTTNRYIKRIGYGNRQSLLDDQGRRLPFLTDSQRDDTHWLFEVVFDYGEHDAEAPQPDDAGSWVYRNDPFSSYRAGFEMRTTRLCQRVLMFHHFPEESGVGNNCLVRSTDFTYSHEQDPDHDRNPIYTFLMAVTQSSYKRDGSGYSKRSMPPVEFEYTQPNVQERVEEVDSAYLENLPIGLYGTLYQWTDLHGEGIPGILTEQGGGWLYKRNLSPINPQPGDGGQAVAAKFAPVERAATKPNLALAAGAQFMDLAGDGLPDLVVMDGPMPGLYEHDGEEGWQPFRPFTSRLNRDFSDPNFRFIDLDGDGHADLLITEDDALVWHASLAESGFGPARRVAQALDEEKGPRLVFADGTQSIHLADLSGDGLTDLVRIRNGEVCYWPNLGYGRFGAKVTMDHAPHFDNPDQFDQKRIRLADIDGSGTTDIIYLHRDGVRLYFNQSGNSWSEPQRLNVFPRIDDLVSIVPVDLLGNGTACLVWSSPLLGDARRPMRYVNLMGAKKPHLLVKTVNNLGAETRVHYAPSTKFYLQDKRDGKAWITRLPFPVHAVERVETFDHISRNRFVSRYEYHHGYFDGEEREFRGFGMVEQWDTEEIGTLAPSDGEGWGEGAVNLDAASNVPPVHTKTWFHTGVYVDRAHISLQFEDEYYREPGLSEDAFRNLLLPDTHLPDGLTLEEEREACRALKGMMLRQEVYTDDAGSDASEQAKQRARTPYSVVEQDFTIRPLQPRAGNRHAVFFTHPREAITYHYERNPVDPRIQHALTLEVDEFGNVWKEAAIGYGRRQPDLSLPTAEDRNKQTRALLTYTENSVTNTIDTSDAWRTPLPCESQTFELTGYQATGAAGRYRAEDFVEPDLIRPGRLRHKVTDDVAYEEDASANPCRRLIERVHTHYRPNDCGAAQNDPLALLPLGELQSLSLPGESYQLAFTPGLLDGVFRRDGTPLLPDPPSVLGRTGGDQGGYVDLDGDGHWWIPSGRAFFSPDVAASPAAELAEAQAHFFLPRRYHDPFGQDAFVDFDSHDLLMAETRDGLGNRVTVDANDYRVLQPRLVSDPNRNRTEVAFDTLGMVAGTAVMGELLPAQAEGDMLAGFVADLDQAQLDAFFGAADPHTVAPALLHDATTRIVYDLNRFRRTQQAAPNDPTQWQPACAVTLARETHASAPLPPQGLKIQPSFSYSDGFGREIQKKIQAEPGQVVQGGPLVNPRWVGSGWIIFNNKGKPVRQYEPFFSATHHFEYGVQVGVSPVLFYDPAERVIATLHPNHTYEKEVFDPWQQTTWDVNDTCAPRNQQTGDPRSDPDIGGYVAAYFESRPPTWQTWHAQRIGNALGTNERKAAERAAAHADTPTTAHFDALGRPFLTVARNRVTCADHLLDGKPDEEIRTRVELDIEGNQRRVFDERKLPDAANLPLGPHEQRIVMRYANDMLGNRIHQLSMEAGARWMLNNVAGKPIRAWDSRGHNFTTNYDALRRPIEQYVRGTTPDSDPRTLNRDILVDKIEYGESLANAEALNLRTQIYRHFDSAGVATNARLDTSGSPIEAYDFKGNLLRSTRRLIRDYKTIPDWSLPAEPPLEAEFFEASTRYDALNRTIQSVAPHSSLTRPGHPNKLNVIQPVFNEANLLERVDVWLERATEPATLLDSDALAPSAVGVANIDYDAKGQRQRIDYNNGASTLYSYDPLTYRLTQLLTQRNAAAFPGDDPQPPVANWPGRQVQNLHYTYDPAGNITHIQDDAQQTIYFGNQRVEPSNDYTYDALYRLIQASGREHLGQVGGAPIPHSHDDVSRVGLLHPSDGNAMGTYIERYVYDAVGNFLQMQHRGSDPAHAGWTRRYTYGEASLIEAGKQSNRLSSTQVGNGVTSTPELYQHDAHGNMVRMPHLGGGAAAPNMQWDYKDQLRQIDKGGGGTAFYVYDASGQRVRKVWEKSPGLTEERIYLGGFEIFRKHNGTLENNATLERETLHVMDDQQRIALVETRTLDTAGADQAPRQLFRYQFGNHLGSTSLELDEQAQIISYEEYAPYGSSTYQAARSQTETAKRYRYTGKERDEESGLYYHGARYYAAWIARWTASDPAGTVDGLNTYGYVRNRPIIMIDPSGQWSWGKVLGIAAAVVVGVAVTALTGGIAGPIVAGVIGGMAAGAAGEIVEAAVEGRPITLRNVAISAAIGGIAGGIFAGAGQLIANTGIGRAMAARLASSGVGQAVSRVAYRIATSESRAAVAARAGSDAVRRGVGALEEAGEAAGRRMGGPFARNAAAQSERRAGLATAQADAEANATSGVQATLRGEVNGQPVNATTRSGVDRSGTGLNAIETPGGRVQAPTFDQLPQPLEPLAVPSASGNTFVRGADAEIKLFGHTLLTTPRDAAGRLYLGVTAPICPSCSANLWQTRSAIPRLQIITDMPSPAAGAAGALDRFIPPQRDDLPPPIPALQLQVNF